MVVTGSALWGQHAAVSLNVYHVHLLPNFWQHTYLEPSIDTSHCTVYILSTIFIIPLTLGPD